MDDHPLQAAGERCIASPSRRGLHAAKIFAAASDFYGDGVNLAARRPALAEAGETIATSQLRDLLSDTLDAESRTSATAISSTSTGPCDSFGRPRAA